MHTYINTSEINRYFLSREPWWQVFTISYFDAEHITSFVDRCVRGDSDYHLRVLDIPRVLVVIAVRLDGQDNALCAALQVTCIPNQESLKWITCSICYRGSGSKYRFVDGIGHQGRGHGNDLRFKLHHRRPDIRMQWVGDGVHAKCFIQ